MLSISTVPPGPVPASRSVPCGSPGRQLWPVGLFCSPWPEQALRANIHCQISLALNRIYTEWYPSKGYTFNITNSTSYDQYYVHGRTVFDVMVRITDDIFNTYIRKTGTVNPYYSEYCDGKSVTCPGLKQWGTVTLANQGRNALQILKYYYGNDIEIIRTSNIQSIPQSYPGSPLRQGDSGTAVFTLQRQLNRITKDYPFLGLLTVDGVFGAKMAATVRAFQKQFNLTADGVVGRQAWYKISYIYVSVKDLAELTSEGEVSSGTLSDGTWGGTVLRTGSTGSAVEQLQFWLNTLAQYESSIPSLTVDGVYGTGTANTVRAFQRKYGLTVDGVVGRDTWTELYDQFRSIQSDNGTPNAYPGTALREGASGQNVRLVQFWLKIARTVYSNLNNITVDGKFGSATTAAVKRFQTYFGLTSDGVVGRTTWNKLYEVYNDIANKLLSSSLRPGEYPGVLRKGSSGTAVRELQFYLYLMSAYESSIPPVSIDGKFGADTERAVRAYQRFAGLTVDGVVGRTTWNSLYGRASQLRSSGPVVTLKRLPYPGAPLTVGSSGKALLLLSGGIDSPVAGYMIAKRGVTIEATYFHAPPYTSDRAKQKVVDLAKQVAKYAGPIKLNIVNFTDIQLYIYEQCPHEELTIIMRRYMMKIAEELAKKDDCLGLITGESIGQVASQTVHSLAVTNAVCTLPVFRPLIGFDKQDIVDISLKIGTYETSIEPYEDCCTIFVAKHPVTKPVLHLIEKSERNLEEKIDALVKEAIDTVEVIRC